jgi:phytoene synthase
MAMQLSNICRDVAEDWQRGRVYLPSELTSGLRYQPDSRSLPARHSAICASAVRRLLAEADVLYRSGDRGLPYLDFRARLSVAAARNVYSTIGQRLLDQGADVLAGRAFVPGPLKLWHVARAGLRALAISIAAPSRPAQLPRSTVRFPEDVLPY